MPMGFEHQFQRIAQACPAFAERPAMGDGSGNFLDPAHEPPVFRADDGVISLSHDNIVVSGKGGSQEKLGVMGAKAPGAAVGRTAAPHHCAVGFG